MSRKLKRCPPGSRKDTKRQNRCFTKSGQEMFRKGETPSLPNLFINLGIYHIMNTPLEHVYTKTWMQKDDCNIFLIGEHHYIRNGKCTGIHEMFQGLLKDVIKFQISPKVDIMVETNEKIMDKNVDTFDIDTSPYLHFRQINNVRRLLSPCIKSKNCPFNVHWTDPNSMIPNRIDTYNWTYKFYKRIYTKTNRKNRLPEWIREIDEHSSKGEWSNNYTPKSVMIRENLYDNKNIIKLLTEHGVVMKEIEKASLVDPRFTIDFAKKAFTNVIKEIQKDNDTPNTYIYRCLRRVTDIYAAARIISKSMKNVIIYEGNNHIIFLKKIFTDLGYTNKMEKTNNQCL